MLLTCLEKEEKNKSEIQLFSPLNNNSLANKLLHGLYGQERSVCGHYLTIIANNELATTLCPAFDLHNSTPKTKYHRLRALVA